MLKGHSLEVALDLSTGSSLAPSAHRAGTAAWVAQQRERGPDRTGGSAASPRAQARGRRSGVLTKGAQCLGPPVSGTGLLGEARGKCLGRRRGTSGGFSGQEQGKMGAKEAAGWHGGAGGSGTGQWQGRSPPSSGHKIQTQDERARLSYTLGQLLDPSCRPRRALLLSARDSSRLEGARRWPLGTRRRFREPPQALDLRALRTLFPPQGGLRACVPSA